MNRAPMRHKQPQTLAEALSFDQLRREAAYQEWLAFKQRFQQEQQDESDLELAKWARQEGFLGDWRD